MQLWGKYLPITASEIGLLGLHGGGGLGLGRGTVDDVELRHRAVGGEACEGEVKLGC